MDRRPWQCDRSILQLDDIRVRTAVRLFPQLCAFWRRGLKTGFLSVVLAVMELAL